MDKNNIALVSFNNSNFKEMAEMTWFNNKVEYAKLHGYNAFHCTEEHFCFEPQYLYYEKYNFILNIFDNYPDIEWIWFTGTDLIITNFTIKLESIIDNNYQQIICADVNGINIDSHLIKNSLISKGLLKWILDTKEQSVRGWPFEQGAIWAFYQQNHLSQYIMKVMPQRVMNSYLYGLYGNQYSAPYLDPYTKQDGEYQFGDFALQLPGVANDIRLKVFSEIQSSVHEKVKIIK